MFPLNPQPPLPLPYAKELPMSRRNQAEDLMIAKTANGYIVEAEGARRNGSSIHSSYTFESIEAAVCHIAKEMGEPVNVYKPL